MKKIVLSFIAASLSASFALTSCSSVKGSNNAVENTEISGNITSSEKALDSGPITLTYAVLGGLDSYEKEKIDAFNAENNGYFIETRDYSSYVANEDGDIIDDEDKFRAYDIAFTQDIVKGEIDIFRDTYLPTEEKMELLAAKGAFADLYEFMENDPEVNRDTLDAHILSLYENKGCLYTLPTYYHVTMLIGETRYVGDKENWTLDDFIEHWEKMPEGSTICGHTDKDYVFMGIMRSTIDSYIDYENAQVHFDDPEFKRMLEYCNTFDDISAQYSEYQYDSIKFVSQSGIHSFSNFHTDTLWNEEGEPVTFVGYPSESGNGAYIGSDSLYSVSATTSKEKQKGAWEFIKRFVTEDNQKEHYCRFEESPFEKGKMVAVDFRGLPINLAAYDSMAQDAMNGVHNDNVVGYGSYEFEVGWLTQEELDRLKEYVNGIKCRKVSYSRDLFRIIHEEVFSYFRGEKSVDEVINILQNRASIWISEQS